METDTTRRTTDKAAPIGTITRTTRWDRALAAFRAADAEYDRLCGLSDEAENAAYDELGPRIDHYFDDYKLGIGMSRESIEWWLRTYNRTHPDSPIEVQKVADEFCAYQQRTLDARKKHRTEELRETAAAYFPTYSDAKADLMELPAPDLEALLVKLELSAMSRDGGDLENALADARRLIRGEA